MLPQLKKRVLINAASTTNAATASGYVDTLGYEWCTIDVIATTSDDVTNNFSVLKIAEGDTTTAVTDIAAFTGDATNGFTIANALTEGNAVSAFNIDLRGRKRYLMLYVSPLTTQVITAIANLGRGAQSPVTAAKAGCTDFVEG